ncbi:hypothetical protein A3J02_02785 [Candidatus Azambacteria bacterium RIFCSPLOWO2_02_FULL_46_11]|uniref:CDP-alcohol phosphatidyltransferase n=1 Tax=Candidatus Azambacteria bacterium RIFCSPLOWO2_02_FULL_46_11 TaxID=1797300 RepID=A0A1F5CR49_9BACT|nr:MAG: hypothetical protein A3J02_02785 [Candidatus Azambacteria bacterium RIFCSPLOWO2_02_FULL_46_11]
MPSELKKTLIEMLTEEEKKKRDNWWLTKWILGIIPFWLKPNVLTFLRVFLVIVSYKLWQTQNEISSLQLLILGFAAITDWIDGSMARTRNQITALGTILDPVADDLLGFWIILLLVYSNALSPLPGFGLIFCELALATGAGVWLLVELIKSRKSGAASRVRVSAIVLDNVKVNIIGRYRFGFMLGGLGLLILAFARDRATLFFYFGHLYPPLILIGIALLVLGFIDNKGRLINIGKFVTSIAIIMTILSVIEPFALIAGRLLVYLSFAAFALEIVGYLKNIHDAQKAA